MQGGRSTVPPATPLGNPLSWRHLRWLTGGSFCNCGEERVGGGGEGGERAGAIGDRWPSGARSHPSQTNQVAREEIGQGIKGAIAEAQRCKDAERRRRLLESLRISAGFGVVFVF